MFYTIYKTTNLINGKFYIGKHQTKDLQDGYMGSGKRLKYAIKKYGIENFHKEILHVVQTEKEMDLLEKILVVPDQEINYNLCQGGKGGFSYINKTLTKSEYSNRGKLGNKNMRKAHKAAKPSEETKEKIRRTLLALDKNIFATFKGKKHSLETKLKIGQANKKYKGKLNSQYGTCWITNGIENKKIKKR